MAKRLLLVAGNIGAGKTSLTERLGERLGWRAGFESVADNPYLADFYGNMAAWAFHLQVYFLGRRAEQHLEAAASPASFILDRSIYEDYHIFTKGLRELGGMSERDYDAYRRVYELVASNLPAPNLLVYLKAPVEVLVERIRARGRDIESGITPDYLLLLDRLYDEWLANFDLCPVLTIHSHDLDFVHKSEHLEEVVKRINRTLAGKEDLVFVED